MNRGCVAFISTLVGVFGCTAPSTFQGNQLHGAWRVAEMHLISVDQDTVEVSVQESLFIFGDGYYSIAYAIGDERSPAYAERWHASDREKVERFGCLIVNAGSYRINGSQLYAQPFFALAPEFVEGQAVFSFQFVDDVLELVWERSVAFDGLEYPSGGTVTLLRLVRVN
jgi:hypothetical protein